MHFLRLVQVLDQRAFGYGAAQRLPEAFRQRAGEHLGVEREGGRAHLSPALEPHADARTGRDERVREGARERLRREENRVPARDEQLLQALPERLRLQVELGTEEHQTPALAARGEESRDEGPDDILAAM